METLPAIVRILQVVFGIGLVIFVHELGHFLAARWCGVRVEIFSIGMGPRVFGWKRGNTTYQIAALPIGGYVRWAGEEWNSADGPPPSDHFAAKTVGQRFLMYSGGVIMNVVFGLVVFPILFWQGVDFVRPSIGSLDPGSPAWQANLPVGAEILEVNGQKTYEFTHVMMAVALGDPKSTDVRYVDPETKAVHTVNLTPVQGVGLKIPRIGIGSPMRRDAEGHLIVEVEPGSPAWDAGLRSGDTLVSFVDALPGVDLSQELLERVLENQPLILNVDGPAGPRRIEFEAQALPTEAPSPLRIGVRPPRRLVAGLRQVSGLPVELKLGDRITSLNGKRILRLGDFARSVEALDGPLAMAIERPLPVQSRDQLEEQEKEQREILLEGPSAQVRWESLVLSAPPLKETERAALIANVAIGLDLDSGLVVPQNGMAAFAAGLRDGDEIRSVDGASIERWSDLTDQIAIAAKEDRPAQFAVTRLDESGVPSEFSFQVRPAPSPNRSYGIAFLPDEYLFHTDGFLASLSTGAVFSWRFLQDTWMTVKRMILGSINARDAMGGPVAIATLSYKVAEQGLAKLFFFLCMLSMNLAFLNVLPIPILDGGHLFFLLVEKIKGSPVSDRVLGYSQLIGIVLILSLFFFVTYNDLARLVFN